MVDKKDIQKARQILDEGGVIGFPTETVYGLAARIDIPSAIEKIFKTKERPFFDPLIVHVSSVMQAKKVAAYWGLATDVLAEAFWPGPLTMVLPKDPQVNQMITSGLDSVGLRMPDHPAALQILETVGVPLAAPSANKFGRTSPTTADHVRGEFQNEDVFVVDGGESNIGIESTVLSVKQKPDRVVLSILRKGHVLKSDIEKVLSTRNISFEFQESIDKKESPGHMKHHYMPTIPLFICRDAKRPPESLMAEANQKLRDLPAEIEGVKIVKPAQGLSRPATLALSEDPVLATRELYGKLRDLANSGADCILFFKDNKQSGERWEGLLDRLSKAASLSL